MIFEKLTYSSGRQILIAAHRGSACGNIPCNTLASYNAALLQKADIVELDVSRSRDGVLYAFHPGMEPAHIGTPILISSRSAKSVDRLRYRNFDNKPTSYRISTLEEAFMFLKGRCYINVDKFPSHPEEITAMIRKCGIEEQVIIKTPPETRHLDAVEKFAPDLMYMAMIREKDDISDSILKRNISYIGAEVLFETDNAPVVSDKYIAEMHAKGLILWGNSIVYNERDIISAGHTDDTAIAKDINLGWGWFADKGFDIIQTDWAQTLREYLNEKYSEGKN